ncbi:MAG TPA: hypothetical protein VHX42_04155 [Candidatus Babeliales bacterium]|jgi:hypothetical protein|nr:hypothetical protein [Candidatus Babeliales bacterium]
MKKVILAALLIVGAGITQCERVHSTRAERLHSFTAGERRSRFTRNSHLAQSLEDLKAVCDSDFDKIKETPEYKLVRTLHLLKGLDHDIALGSKILERRHAKCESFKNSGMSFSGIDEYACKSAQMWEEGLADAKKTSVHANNELEILIAKNPALKEVCLSILALEKQKRIDSLEKSAQ